MELMSVPPWVEHLLSTTFFTACEVHTTSPRNELCNMYCLDCRHQAFCYFCMTSFHKDHHVIQIRRSSYHNVVRISEIQKVLDISGVQTYVINSARVIFLNHRPHNHNQPKPNAVTRSVIRSNATLCEICSRNLFDPFRFCSLECKLKGIKKKNENASIVMSEKKDEEKRRMLEGISRRLALKEEDEESCEGIHKQVCKSTCYSSSCPRPSPQASPNSRRRRRRKGIPHRAPLG